MAIKVLSDALSVDRAALDRFQREARAASALNHPNICAVHDVGEAAGHPFLVMELLDGQTLREYLDGKPLTVSPVSKDPQAARGKITGGFAKGYKLYAFVNEQRLAAPAIRRYQSLGKLVPSMFSGTKVP